MYDALACFYLETKLQLCVEYFYIELFTTVQHDKIKNVIAMMEIVPGHDVRKEAIKKIVTAA